MTEMPETPPNEENLAREFQALGKNLVQALRAAWENPEFKRVQTQIVTSVGELGSTLKREADTISSSSTGQQMKSAGQQFINGVEQVGERIRTSDAQEKLQRELLNVLRSTNSELQKVVDRWSSPSEQAGGVGGATEGGATPEAPAKPGPGEEFRMLPGVEAEISAGTAVEHHGWQLTPFLKQLHVRIPGLPAGLHWAWPTTVLATAPDGREQVLQVQDPTRRVTWVLLGMALAAFLGMAWFWFKNLNRIWRQ